MNKFTNSVKIGIVAAVLLLGAGSVYLLAQGRGQSSGPGGEMRQPPSADQIFAREDKDKDGLISKDEFGGPAEHFSHFDTDGNGYLTREEVIASLKNPPQRNGGGGQGRGNRPRSQQNGPPEQDFSQMDTDGDGVISAEEFTGPADHFSLIDADQDGALTEEELDDARESLPSPGNRNPPRQTAGNTTR